MRMQLQYVYILLFFCHFLINYFDFFLNLASAPHVYVSVFADTQIILHCCDIFQPFILYKHVAQCACELSWVFWGVLRINMKHEMENAHEAIFIFFKKGTKHPISIYVGLYLFKKVLDSCFSTK